MAGKAAAHHIIVIAEVPEPQIKQTLSRDNSSIPSMGPWSSFWHLRVKHKLKSWLERQQPVVLVAGVPQKQQQLNRVLRPRPSVRRRCAL